MDNIVLDKTIKVTSGFPSSLHAQKHNLWRLVEYGFTVRDHMSFLHPINQQWQSTDWHTLTDTHTHTLTALCLGLHEWAGTTKVNQFGLYRKDSKWQWHQLGYMSLHLTSDRQPHQYRTTQVFLQAGCPSCYLTNSAKALKKTQNTDPKKWLGLICSSFTRIQQTVHTVLGVYLKTYLFVCY